MRYLSFRQLFNDFIAFSWEDIRTADPHFYRTRLNEWQAKGYIRKIINGWYMFSDVELTEDILCVIANRIYQPSYVSLQFVLSHEGLIPEGVYAVTSVSTLRTNQWSTPVGVFKYQSVKPDLFFGYEIRRVHGQPMKIAVAEKALLDYFYFHSRWETLQDFEALRINADVFREKINIAVFKEMLERFHNKALSRRVNIFLESMAHA